MENLITFANSIDDDYFLIFLVALFYSLERIFGKVFITPNLHKLHNDQNQFYTDSNYADIFVFWDKLFGTYKYTAVKNLRYGIKEFDDNKKQTFWYQLICPFLNIQRITDKKY